MFFQRYFYLAVLTGAAFIVLASASLAEWKPEYANTPKEIRDWFANAELTPTAQKRLPWKKCCDHADVVKTQFRVNRNDGNDEWCWLKGEEWRRIPADIIHWDESAPTGEATLFIYSNVETCFWPPLGGI